MTSGTRRSTTWRRFGLVHDQRRQQADDVVGGDVDHQPGVERLLHQLAAGLASARRRSSGPCRGRRPPALPIWLLSEDISMISPTRALLASRPSSLMVSMRGDHRGHGERVAAEGRAVVAGLEHALRAAADDAGADRHARGEALGERHHVGLEAGVLVDEPLAGAAEAALHLVGDEQPAVLRRRSASARAGTPGARR